MENNPFQRQATRTVSSGSQAVVNKPPLIVAALVAVLAVLLALGLIIDAALELLPPSPGGKGREVRHAWHTPHSYIAARAAAVPAGDQSEMIHGARVGRRMAHHSRGWTTIAFAMAVGWPERAT